MKTFTILKNYQNIIEAVKEGWSWPGFFFAGIWLLIKQLWIHAAIVILVSLLLPPIGIFAWFVVGAAGNGWRRDDLLKKGYENCGVIAAHTPEEAISNYVKEHKSNN